MNGTDYLKDALIETLAQRRAILVIGAGVSAQATANAQTASWRGLIESGIDLCHALSGRTATAEWRTAMLQLLRASTSEGWLAIAEEVTRRLGGVAGGEWFGWLERSFGDLAVANPEILRSIKQLRDEWRPIVMTTNYDDLLERQFKARAVTWRDVNGAIDVIARTSEDVLHLHGYWREPASVILGVRSYDQLLGDELAQSVQKAAAILNSFVFIGCGDGLHDPNLGLLHSWIDDKLKGAKHRHYVLLRADHAEAFRLSGRLVAVSYGKEYSDLAPFLRSLTKQRESPVNPKDLKIYTNALPAPRHLIDRNFIEDVADALTNNGESLRIVQEADSLRAVADPNRPPVRPGLLSLEGNSFQFWDSAFRQFELQSIRAMAALLLILPTATLSLVGKTRRMEILNELRRLSDLSTSDGADHGPGTSSKNLQ
ncbi:SIR2 family NAD-dependent protein deacylase [Bradyrhizobium sp. YCK136]|uniref:SIR2 family NAD-dependent protein deacylase n=1 Tax=Bradyrhizobium sp. YCK136 TaxID=3351346 RepID=UPI0037CA48A8